MGNTCYLGSGLQGVTAFDEFCMAMQTSTIEGNYTKAFKAFLNSRHPANAAGIKNSLKTMLSTLGAENDKWGHVDRQEDSADFIEDYFKKVSEEFFGMTENDPVKDYFSFQRRCDV